MKFYPDKMKELTGFQTYVILTDSMEPTIPVGSLVIDRCLDDEDEIKENTIDRNLLGGLYRENSAKSRNYEAVKSSKKWENVGNSYIIPALLLYRYSYI